MAGHSKWANIKHRKGRQDAKRGKIFSVLIRELTVAAKLGGGVPDDNPRLRTAVDKALSANMTKDTIERAIQRGAGGLEGENLEEVSFEGYGPGGIAIMVESMTDNNNRTVAEVRHAFTKSGGNLGTNGSVSYLFEKKGIITVSSENDADEVMESWRIVDDLLCTGDSCPIRTVPYIYLGGWGPQHKVDRITDWDYPA